MKKILCLIMSIVLCLSIVGCGKKEVTYKIGDTVSTERVSVTLKNIKPTIAVNNSGSWTSSTGYATESYFTPVDEYENGNPFAARKGSSLIWFEVEIKNLDRDSLEMKPWYTGVDYINFQIEYDGETYYQNSDNTEIGTEAIETIDGINWKKYVASNILLLAGKKGSYRLYTEIPKELSADDEFKLIVNLPNTEGKSDRFVYHINNKTEE